VSAVAGGPRRDTEAWFLSRGLPYFVDTERDIVRRGLRPGRLLAVSIAALLVGCAVGVVIGLVGSDVSGGLVIGLLVALAVLGLYAATTLRLQRIATWAARRTLRSLGLLFPLVTRALPLLLLFVTFLFINTEVWMVADSLDRGVLTLAVLLFAGLAVAFLLVRLPEEVDRVDDDIDRGRLAARCATTPVEGEAASAFARVDDEELARLVTVTGLQKWNLVLALLVAQAVQVLLLSLAVLLFFLVFGSVIMEPEVVASWLGRDEIGTVPGLGGLSSPLVKVSVFLAGFSGLYFTVYAVTDDTYRRQFFTSVTDELERAVAVRAVYRALAAAPTR
jgi:hypothetical protein